MNRTALRALLLVGVATAVLATPAAAQNVILVIADDVGAEWFDAYGEQTVNPPTPTIQSLANDGLLFRNAWAYPVCSPFRVSVYSGEHPHEHGVGHGINGSDPDRDYVLDPSSPNLGNLLAAAGYRTSAVGKWHMATELGFSSTWFYDNEISLTEGHPNLAGMQRFSGFLFGGLLYFDWFKTVDGFTIRVTDYATTDTADAALDDVAGSEPFFLWMAFNAPHGVFHVPPAELLADPSIYGSTQRELYRAMIEAMDTELGRVLAQVDWSDTTVVFVADNGTLGGFQQPPRSKLHGKGTVYETGVRVPLIVAGQAVAGAARGAETDALVQATDLFATILELCGVVPPARDDSVSLLPYLQDPATPPLRDAVFTELFTPNGGPPYPQEHLRAARGPRYKLVRRGLLADELYDLEVDPYETSPLQLQQLTPEERRAYRFLQYALGEAPPPSPIPALPPPGLLGLGAILAVIAWLRSTRPRTQTRPGR